jgi:hypothetical protein
MLQLSNFKGKHSLQDFIIIFIINEHLLLLIYLDSVYQLSKPVSKVLYLYNIQISASSYQT